MRSRTYSLLVLLLACLTAQSFAMPNRHKLFAQPCNIVWKAAVAGVKSDKYRILAVSDEHRLISLSTGISLSYERVISVSLEDLGATGCMVTAQSRFHLFNHDGPDLLKRIEAELRRETEDSRAQPPAETPPKEHMQDWWQKK